MEQKIRKRLFYFLGLLLFGIFPLLAKPQSTFIKDKNQNISTGLQDRAYWCSVLYKILSGHTQSC
jgi:hypothetical protein